MSVKNSDCWMHRVCSVNIGIEYEYVLDTASLHVEGLIKVKLPPLNAL